MSVSSVGAAPVVALKPVEAPPAPPNDKDSDDSRTAPPPPRAALPPGQGTRIDLLV